MKPLQCLMLALLMSLGADLHGVAQEQQVSLKLTKISPLPQNLPEGVLNDLNKRRERLEAWRSKVKQRVEQFNSLGPVKPGSAAESARRRDLEKLASETMACSRAVQKFNDEVEMFVISPAPVGSVTASSSRNWSAAEKKKVLDALGAFKDSQMREWVEHKARSDRVAGTPSSLPPAASDMISANGAVLTFKDGFFDPRASDTKRENLLAFEAGKVLWAANLTSKVEGQSLAEWFKGYLETNPGLVEEMKAARHQGEGLSDLGDLPDTQSRFAHLFRAKALSLGSKEQQSQLKLFKGAISPLLER